jgi:hypothetical protein
MIISKAFYRHLPIFLNLFKCPLRGLICLSDAYITIEINDFHEFRITFLTCMYFDWKDDFISILYSS